MKTSKFRRFTLVAIAAVTSVYPMATAAKAAAFVADVFLGPQEDRKSPGFAVGANTLTGLIPTIYESLDVVSRELVGMVTNVTTDNSIDRAALNQVVMSYATPAVTASNVTPGVTAPNDGDQVIGNIPITISKSRYVPIRWNGEEQRGINTGPGAMKIMGDQFAQAFRTLVNEAETDLASLYKSASRAVGTAGTTPFGINGDITDFSNARQVLEDNGAPTSALKYVAGGAAINNLRGKQAVLFRVNEAGTDTLLRQGAVGEVGGLMVGNSAQIKAVVKGTGAGYTTSGAALGVGVTVIPLITGAGTVLAGDVVTFAGDTNKYVVAVGVGAPGSITIGAPGLRVAIPAAATAMTIGNSYTPNLAFAKTAIVLATRIPATPVDIHGRPMDMADDRTIVVDPFSGLAFEVALYTQYRQIKYEIAIAWGFAAVKPEHIVVGMG